MACKAMLAFVALLVAAPCAAAQGLPGEERAPGVELRVGMSGELLVVFTRRAAPLYRALAGRRIFVSCERAQGWPANREPAPQRYRLVPVRRASRVVRTGIYPRRGGWDRCQASRSVKLAAGEGAAGASYTYRTLVGGPVTARGRLAADVQPALGGALNSLWMVRALTSDGSLPLPAVVAGAFPGTIEALAAANRAPARGHIGYWSDGTRAATVALSRAGRRAVARLEADLLETTALSLFRDPLRRAPTLLAREADRPSGIVGENGPAGRLTLTFGAAADALFAALYGRQLYVSCRGGTSGFGTSATLSARTVQLAPSVRDMPLGPWDLCTVYRMVDRTLGSRVTASVQEPVAGLALTPAGLLALDEGQTRGLAEGALLTGQALGAGGRYAPADVVAAASRGLVTALPGPGTVPPPGLAGYWSDGERHAYAAMTTLGGKLLFFEEDGPLYRTNAWFVAGPP